MEESASDPLAEFRKMNRDVTVRMAQAAKQAGVRRFIFLSSVKVNGEETFETPFRASDEPKPQDPYGVSKMEAEQALLQMHQPGVFEVIIIRPPLVYGPQVKANFRSLFNLVGKKLPLPFGAVKNRRSLVSVLNLVDLIIHCFSHPQAGGHVFLVSDDHDLSLKDLLQEMAKVQQVPLILIPVPVSLMTAAATLLGKKSYADRLFGNLHLDISETKNLLNWKPKFSFADTFQEK
jgi:UDP-glucose 4-epimerase